MGLFDYERRNKTRLLNYVTPKILNQTTYYKLHFLAGEAEGTVYTIIRIRHMGVYRYEKCVCF